MDKRTIDTYNLIAKEYEAETADFWERFPDGFLSKFASSIEGRVLDLGSGPGRDGLMLKEKGMDVVCLDASSAMVSLRREKGLEALEGDFLKLPFAEGSFGGVWAYTSLLHITKAEFPAAIKEVHRALAPRGVLGLGLIEGEGEIYRESAGQGMPRLFSFYGKEETEDYLTQAGFEILHFESFVPKSKTYMNFLARKI